MIDPHYLKLVLLENPKLASVYKKHELLRAKNLKKIKELESKIHDSYIKSATELCKIYSLVFKYEGKKQLAEIFDCLAKKGAYNGTVDYQDATFVASLVPCTLAGKYTDSYGDTLWGHKSYTYFTGIVLTVATEGDL